jgi:hypothetical protein
MRISHSSQQPVAIPHPAIPVRHSLKMAIFRECEFTPDRPISGAVKPPQTPKSPAARSRSKEIAAGNFGWGKFEPLQIARVGLID